MQHKNPEYFKRIEVFINEYQEVQGISPSNSEISKGTGLSTATVSRYLAKMKEEGNLFYNGYRSICTREMREQARSIKKIPLIGDVSCGIPLLAEENIIEYISFPSKLLADNEYFFLRAKGDSMIGIGIAEGDLVLIKRQNYAESGNVAVILIEDEATLKRYFPEREQNRVKLHPENETMDDIYVERCEIQGIAVKVLKDIQ